MSDNCNVPEILKTQLVSSTTSVRLRGNKNTTICRNYIFRKCTRKECAFRHWLSEDEVAAYLICRDFQNFPIFGDAEGKQRFCKNKRNIIRKNCKFLHKGWREMNNLVSPSEVDVIGRIEDHRFAHIPIVYSFLLQGGVEQQNSASPMQPASEAFFRMPNDWSVPPPPLPPMMAPMMVPHMMVSPMMAPLMMAPLMMAPPTMAPPTMAPPTMAPPTMAPPTMAPPMMAHPKTTSEPSSSDEMGPSLPKRRKICNDEE